MLSAQAPGDFFIASRTQTRSRLPTLDRWITVRRTLTTRDLFGEHDLDVIDYPQWATRLDLSQADKEQAGGVLTQPRGRTSCAIERRLPTRSRRRYP